MNDCLKAQASRGEARRTIAELGLGVLSIESKDSAQGAAALVAGAARTTRVLRVHIAYRYRCGAALRSAACAGQAR